MVRNGSKESITGRLGYRVEGRPGAGGGCCSKASLRKWLCIKDLEQVKAMAVGMREGKYGWQTGVPRQKRRVLLCKD